MWDVVRDNVKSIITALTAVAMFVSGTFAYLAPSGPGWIPASRHHVEMFYDRQTRIENLERRISALESAYKKLDEDDPDREEIQDTLAGMENELESLYDL